MTRFPVSALRWSFMLYQLFAYYLTDLHKTTHLWGYIGTTVVIFQNAAALEVNANPPIQGGKCHSE